MGRGTANLGPLPVELGLCNQMKVVPWGDLGEVQGAEYKHLGQWAQCLLWCTLVPKKYCLYLHRHWAEPGIRRSRVRRPHRKSTHIGVR